jgi:hypothetical protein
VFTQVLAASGLAPWRSNWRLGLCGTVLAAGKKSPKRFSRWSPLMTKASRVQSPRTFRLRSNQARKDLRASRSANSSSSTAQMQPLAQRRNSACKRSNRSCWVNRRLWRGSPPYTRMVFMRASTQSSAVDCQISAAVWSAASASWYLINSAACPASAS